MVNTLLIPIHLDALCLPADTSVMEEMTDYSKLPYLNKTGGTTNPDSAYLSETALSPPFGNPNLTLKAGIHLHWALPDALTTGKAEADGITFPVVPNRWLIVRRGGNKPEKQWVVESDYLYPESAEGETPPDAINILHNPGTGEFQPFRFLGRKLELSQWRSGTTNTQYIKELSAIGPFAKIESLDNEKAAFAGFYPNCRSVFGFHDDEFKGATPPNGLQYDVIGWYSNSEKDCLAKFVIEHSDNAQTLLEALQEKMAWTVALDTQNFPDRILCYSQLKFSPGSSLSDPSAKYANPTIAVGSTQEEAIATYLASQLDTEPENRKKIEGQLEALQMSDRLQQHKLDFGPKFREVLHESGFVGQTKEMLWRVVSEDNSSIPASAARGEAQAQVTLPTSIGDQINTVNGLQQDYDRKLAVIGSIREQVYADWYKFMLADYIYTGVGTSTTQILNQKDKKKKPQFQNRGDSGLIKEFIQLPAKPAPGKKGKNQYGLPALNDEIKATGRLSLTKDTNNQDKFVKAEYLNSESNSIAAQLANSIQSLIDSVARFNKESRLIAPNGSQLTVEGSCTLVADLVAGKCLEFKDTNYYKVSGLENVRAISMWVKIPEGQKGYLLDARNHLANSGVTANGIGNSWEKMYVNGQEVGRTWANIPKNQWLFLYLEAGSSFSGAIHLMSNFNRTENLLGSIASVYFHQQPRSQEEIQQSYKEKISLLRPSYILKIVPGPRYWQPSDPVILMTGDAVTATHRHGEDGGLREDGLLECQLLTETINWQEFPKNLVTIITKKVDELAKLPGEKIGFHNWTNQPWNPFLLQWKVQFFPLQHNSQNTNNYDADILKANYELQVKAVELLPKSTAKFDETIRADDSHLYEGASFLTPSATTLLKENLADYLKKYLLPKYYVAKGTPEEEQTEDFLSRNFQAVKDWYQPEDSSADNPTYTALRAYDRLQSLNCLAQSLGGFNDALLTYNRTMQLGVEDKRIKASVPAKPEYKFLRDVRTAVANAASVVPGSILRSLYLFNEFNPIRAGGLKISGLQIIDTFGRFKVAVNADNSPNTQVVTSQPLTPPPNFRQPIYLPPRLTQPARLNFRWLSASQGQQEMNDNPSTTPVCGWILPNNLDNSLTIYDDRGSPLGILDRTSTWRAIPGSNQAIAIDSIANKYLRQMVQYLDQQGEGFFTDFLTTVNKALETIDPEGFAQNQAISLLVARPLALVRSQVNLELQGLPAISQNHAAFSADVLKNDDRTTDDFPKVKFPIRIGEYQQFNDSLVGYWVETAQGTYKDSTFYAPQSCYVPHPQVKTLFDNAADDTPDTPVNLEQTLEANTAQTLVMLVDPRGQVSATCGILPAKRISIPPEQYVPALQAMEVMFLSAPLLSDINQINLSLPEVPGYVWSWLGKEQNNWSTSELKQFNSQATLSSQQKIYEGWLKLTRNRMNP